MRATAAILACLAGVSILTAETRAQEGAAGDTPYESIAKRNVFSLGAPQSPVAGPRRAEPGCVITPHGIMSVFGQAQVLFQVVESAKAPSAQKPAYYILSAGEASDGISVLSIDPSAGAITFDNHGLRQTLLLTNSEPSGFHFSGMGRIPADSPARTAGVIGAGRIPPYFGGDDAAGDTTIPKTKEQQMLMIEALRAYYKSHNDPRADTLPPTSMTPP